MSKKQADWDTRLTAAAKLGAWVRSSEAEAEDFFLLTETRARVVHLVCLAGDDPDGDDPGETPEDERMIKEVVTFLGDCDGGEHLGCWRPDQGWFEVSGLSREAQRALEPMARAAWDAAH